jgi:hypothetical protein
MCVADTGSLTSLFVEVTSPGSSPVVPGVPLLTQLELDERGGPLDIVLPPLAKFIAIVQASRSVVQVDADKQTQRCELDFVGDEPGTHVLGAVDGSIPVSVSFVPRERIKFPGFPTTSYAASVDPLGWESATPAIPGTLSFPVSVPAGSYDIYFEPRRAVPGACEIPPSLLLDHNISMGFSIVLPAPSRLDVSVRWPAIGNSLKNWLLELLDPVTGRRISTQVRLGDPVISGSEATYTASLLYTPVYVSKEGTPVVAEDLLGREIISLSPGAATADNLIEEVAMPTILASRSALELFPNGSGGTIEQRTTLPAPVIIEGFVNAADEPKTLAANVTIVAKRIEGIDAGVLASFVREIEVPADGKFAIKLLPGDYEVRAVPTGGDDRAITTTVWEISGDKAYQGGRTIELAPSPLLRGVATLPGSGSAASGASVRLAPSAPSTQPDALAGALGDVPPKPRAGVDLVSSDGVFEIPVDPGAFDLTVRPDAGSRFGWYVDSRLAIAAAEGDHELSDRIALPWPIAYRGRVLLDSEVETPLAGALIRAYAYVTADGVFTSDPAEARSVVQVAETRADGDGNYELLIPASLN